MDVCTSSKLLAKGLRLLFQLSTRLCGLKDTASVVGRGHATATVLCLQTRQGNPSFEFIWSTLGGSGLPQCYHLGGAFLNVPSGCLCCLGELFILHPHNEKSLSVDWMMLCSVGFASFTCIWKPNCFLSFAVLHLVCCWSPPL